jgi:adenylate kinase family enzyme
MWLRLKRLDDMLEETKARRSMPSCSLRWMTQSCSAASRSARPRQKVGRAQMTTLDALKKRLDVYHAQTAPLIEYYSAKGNLRSVDGMAAMDDVTRQIMEVLEG